MEKKVTLNDIDFNHILRAIHSKLMNRGVGGVCMAEQEVLSTTAEYHQSEETIQESSDFSYSESCSESDCE